MASIADNFRGLPIEDLIVSPMVGMAKGQAKLNDVTWKYITEVAFIPNEKKGEPAETRAIDVEMNRVMTDGTTGTQTIQKVYSKVPMLPLVPLPSLAITKADINFTMEVQTSTMHKDSSDTSFGMSSTTTGKAGSFFGSISNTTTFTGQVATHRENTRKTDNSAKYDVAVHCEQLPATAGMLTLSDFLTQMMEPSPIPLTKNPNQ